MTSSGACVITADADGGPSIQLDLIDALNVLSVHDELLVPRTVLAELEAETARSSLDELEDELVDADHSDLGADLDPGETASLAIANERNAILLTDDLAAREAVTELGVEVHGSIGVIVLAYRRCELMESSAVDTMRALLTETSLYVTDAVIERGISL